MLVVILNYSNVFVILLQIHPTVLLFLIGTIRETLPIIFYRSRACTYLICFNKLFEINQFGRISHVYSWL